jgi:hypothetical protein
MKEKKKVKGGKRAGAGRKPSGRQKEAVTVYADVSRFGGKAGARIAIYEFLDGKITNTGKKSFVPLDEKKFPPSDREIKQNAPKEEKRPMVTDLTKPTGVLKPHEQPKSNFTINTTPIENKAEIMTQIAELEKELKSPPKNPVVGLTIWKRVREEQLQNLKNKLTGCHD